MGRQLKNTISSDNSLVVVVETTAQFSPPSATAAATAELAGTRQDLTDGGCEAHDPNLYAYQSIAPAFGDGTLSSACGATCTDEIKKEEEEEEESVDTLEEKYRRDGLLVFPKAFSKYEVNQLDTAITELTTGQNKEFASRVLELVHSGKIPDFTSGDKIPWVQYEAGTDVSPTTLLQPNNARRVRKLMGFVGYDKAIDETVHNLHLEEIVARLLHCQVNELELFQDMALLKPAHNGREKPWHQDKAYFDIGLETPVVGCWIAIDEATCENGCMRMLRGGHVKGPKMHFVKRDYQICDDDVLLSFSNLTDCDVVAVPLPAGGLVLFDGMLPHGTPTNTTSKARRALQFHWVKRGALRVGRDKQGGRTQTFGGTAHGLTC